MTGIGKKSLNSSKELFAMSGGSLIVIAVPEMNTYWLM
jgi:hypothetical protein